MAPERLSGLRRWAAALLVIASPLGAEPANPGQANAELTELRARIGALQERLQAARAKESAASAELRDVEQRISRVTRSLRKVNASLKQQERRLADSQQQYKAVSEELEVERRLLARQIRAAYVLGRQEHMKLLFNQEDPARLGRSLTYYRYLNQKRLVRIDRVETTLARVEQLQEQIAYQREELTQTQASQAAEAAELARERGKREDLLRTLQAEIRAQGNELADLQKDEKRLEQLVKELQRALADLTQAGPRHQSFAKQKRKLSWPVAGKLKARYGDRRDVGNLRWRGVFIEAPANQDIRAVSNGRVAFADWLRGFGLLIIIDHGDDYMTLYGHNQALFKDVGDWVEPGDVIASVGDTGGMARPGLYFELRHKGEPQNPQTWCAGLPETRRAAR